MPAPHDLLFARWAQEYGLMTSREVEACHEALAAGRSEEVRDFRTAAEKLGFLSPYQIAGLDVLIKEEEAGRGKVDTVAGGRARPAIPIAPFGASARPPKPGETTVADPHFGDPKPRAAARRRVTLGGYTILREVGRGGMGIVYEAIQLRLNRRVALKVLATKDMEPEGFERLKREALAAARLQHPNVVQVYDAGEDDGLPYFAMEFVSGASLASPTLQQEITFERAGRLILQAAEGLGAAHRAGIIHRDVKPGNLLVGESDRLLLTDFGLARDTAAQTITGSNQILGTPRYMSPEQANGIREEVDYRTDIYSLGATLYELVTRKPIFDERDGHILHQVLFTDPKPPRKHNPRIPQDLETIILKAVAHDAHQRYPSMEALASDLRAYLRGEEIATRRPGLWSRVQRRVRRHRQVAWLGAATAVLAIGLLGVSYFERMSLDRKFEQVRSTARSLLGGGRSREAADLLSMLAQTYPDRAEILVLRAEARENLNEIEAAATDLSRALEIDPGNSMVLAVRARIYRQLGRWKEALEDAQRGLKLDPKSILCRMERARIELGLGAAAEALQSAELVLSASSSPRERGEAFLIAAQAHRRLGRFEEMERSVAESIRAIPDADRPRVLLGDRELQRGRVREALRAYTDATDRNPGNWRAFLSRVECLWLLLDDDEAMQDLEEASRLAPDHAELAIHRARLLRPEERIAYLEQQLLQHPADWPLRAALCRTALEAGNGRKALGWLEAASARGETDGEADLLRAEALERSGQAPQARALADPLSRQEFPDPAVLALLGRTDLARGEPEEARSLLTRSLNAERTLDSTAGWLLNRAGETLDGLLERKIVGRRQSEINQLILDGLRACGRASWLRHDLSLPWSVRGTFHLLLAQFDEAARCFHRALEINPANRDARLGLANLYRDCLQPPDLQMALGHVSDAVRFGGDDPLLLAEIADLKIAAGDVDTGLQRLGIVCSTGEAPAVAFAYRIRGSSPDTRSDVWKADFGRWRNGLPEIRMSTLFFMVGKQVSRDKNPEHAETLLTRALDYDFSYVPIHMELAQIQRKLSKYIASLLHQCHAIRLDPTQGDDTFTEVYRNRLAVRATLAIAQKEISALRKERDYDPAARFAYAFVLSMVGKHEVAAAECDRLLEEEPGFVFARIHSALVRFELGRPAEAQSILDALGEHSGKFGYEWYVRALLAAQARNREGTLDALHKARDRAFLPGDLVASHSVFAWLEGDPAIRELRGR